MNTDELEERIAAFVNWDYRFEFDDGTTTPLLDKRMVNRQEQRRRYFFDALIRLYGGSLSGQRVLDLGCGAGFWALQALEAGADFVLGVDADQMRIDQAQLVFEAKGIDPSRYAFEAKNIFQCDLSAGFDVVLCLSLTHQISKPVELFELMTGVGSEIIVLETALSPAASSFFEVSVPHSAIDHKIALIPTRDAVVDLASEFGYSTVALARNITDYRGMDDYRRQQRLAFFCSKSRSLAGLALEDPWVTPWWLGPLRDPRGALRRLRA
jgi:SAM-dependent methyltransferase